MIGIGVSSIMGSLLFTTVEAKSKVLSGVLVMPIQQERAVSYSGWDFLYPLGLRAGVL